MWVSLKGKLNMQICMRRKELRKLIFFFNDMFSLSILKQKPVRGNGHVKERITEGLSHQVLLYINWRAQVSTSSLFKAYLAFLIFELWFLLFVGLLSKVFKSKGLLELKWPSLLPDPRHIWAGYYVESHMNCISRIGPLQLYTLYPKLEIP